VTTPKGHASVGMPPGDAERKFLECAEPVLGAEVATHVYAGLAAMHGPDPSLDWVGLLALPLGGL
jgi:hypothetical protein